MDLAFKQAVYTTCRNQLSERMTDLQVELDENKRAAADETKSSVGDKYETGRAMLAIEQQRLEKQFAEMQRLFNTLALLKPAAVHQQAQSGSIIETNQGVYYLSVGLGEVSVEGRKVYCISLQSPIGTLLKGLRKGSSSQFRGKLLKIESVV